METMCKVMKLKLGRIFLTTSDRDTFIIPTKGLAVMLDCDAKNLESMHANGHALHPLFGSGQWDWTPQIQISMETMCKVMKLKLGRIFLTTSYQRPGRDA
jgi:hypothetical protein